MVISMDKQQRQTMIDDLQQRNEATQADIAERKHQRELRGEYFERTPKGIDLVFKTNQNGLIQPQPKQQPMIDHDSAILALADEVALIVGELRDEIRLVRDELAILRGVQRGEISELRKKSDAA